MDYTPLNRHEKYLNAIMNGDNDNLPKPENREEAYLYNIAINSGGGGEDYSVKYTEQSLTSEQQAQARENIGAAASDDIPTDAVKYTAQPLTDAQKAQARTNIGAGTSNFNGNYNALSNAPPIAKSSGENAAAGGYYSTASGQYGFAFGYRVVTTHAGEVAFGKHNESSEDTAFAIGDGRDIQYRHNLMELKTDGRMFLNGNAVKTEDEDNKLRLGQMFDLSNTNPYGIYDYNSGAFLKSVEFSSVEVPNNKVTDAKQVGDFVLYRTGTSPSTDKMVFAPIAGRTAGKTLTGAWVKAECLYELFNNCSILLSIDLSPVDTSAVRDMTRMFYKCTSLTTLDLSSFDMTNVVAYTDMFGDSSNPAGITTLKTPKINPHDDIPLPRTLYSQDGTAYTNLPVTTGTSIELRQSWT